MSQKTLARYLVPALLIVVLAAAAGLRFYNLNWDNGIFAHPDERSTVVFYAPTIQWPQDLSTLLDPRASTLNPFWDVLNQSRRSYTYGHFPLYALVLVAHTLHGLAPLADSLGLPVAWVHFMDSSLSGQGYAQTGRALAALADLFTVYLVFLIGRRLYGPWGGLLAAALAAFTVLQIQLAHFFAVDPISTTFTLLALYGAMHMYDRPAAVGPAIWTGVGIGLAVASKFSALPVAFAPLAAVALASLHGHTLSPRRLGPVLLTFAVALAVFAVTSPFVFLDFENFRRAVLDEQGNMVSGVADFPFTRQYRGTLAYWYFIEQQLRWGMGWPLGLLALAGTLWAVVKAALGKAQPGEWLILGWIILYFGPTGLFLAKFMRYMVPVVPLFTLFGAGLVIALWRFRPGQREAGEPTQRPINEAMSREAIEAPPLPPRSPAPSLARLAQGLAAAVAIVALAGAIFWSLAFANGVYGTEHPWVTFARWVYANVPDGACIAREHWDEGIPASIPEPRGNPFEHRYVQPELPMYEEDTQEKYENLRATLMNCDYIALASNRLWRTIPRLPERYPMSSRYYQALFSGALGFEPIYTVETPPRLGPFVLDDQAADESFTVYDHPRPILFKKVRQLSAAEWDALLGNTWQAAIPGYVGSPTLLMRLRGLSNSPGYSAITGPVIEAGGKSLLLDTPVEQLPIVDDYHWNTPANNSTPVAVAVWWLAVTLVGLLAWPLVYLLFNRLPDRGYGLAKSLGLLLVSYFVWINSSLGWLPNRLTTVILAVIILAGCGLWAALAYRRQLVRFWHRGLGTILAAEAVFGLVFLFFIYLRLLNPDLWQPWLGGEKMLEIGFLNAIVKSARMPPYDPFFAGGIINYYYYGLFMVGVLIKLTGIQPAIAFNLAVPMLAALTAVNAFSLAANLARARLPFRLRAGASDPDSPALSLRPVLVGLLAVLFIVFIGNLEGAAQLLRELANVSGSDFHSAIPGLTTLVQATDGLVRAMLGQAYLATYNYWDPTRVIPATINEFPYFSFLFADLHPHMIGLPFTILFLSLAYNWLAHRPAAQLAAAPQSESGGQPEMVRPALSVPPSEAIVALAEPVAVEELARESTPAAALSRADRQGRPEYTGAAIPLPGTGDDPARVGAATSETGTAVEVSGGRSDHPLTIRRSSAGPALVGYAWPLLTPAIPEVRPGSLAASLPGYILRWLALPFVLGALAVINTWDLPTYLGLMMATFLLTRYRLSRGTLAAGAVLRLAGLGALFAGLLLVATYLLYAPFFAHYQALDVGLGLVYTQTALDQHLKIWGFFLFILVTWLWISLRYPATRQSLLRAASLLLRRWNVWPHLHEIYQQVVRREGDFYQLGRWSLLLVVFLAVVLALLGYLVPAYLLPLVVLAGLLLLRQEVAVPTAFLGLLVFTGLLVLLGVEFFFLRDFLGGGEYYRMNTLFKFFIQVWVLFGLAAAVGLPQIWEWSQRWPAAVQMVWRLAFMALLMAVLVYPIFGTRTRVDDRFPGETPPVGTLDGLAYMTVGIFEWPAGSPIYLKYDYDAIRWLQEHVTGTPVIAEAKVGFYREGGMRVAAYTGLPSILGGLHQNEQRYPSQVGERDWMVNEFWTNPDPARTLDLIRQLNIRYIYLGQIERITYGNYIQDRFEQLRSQGALKVVYENEQTKIYEVVRPGA